MERAGGEMGRWVCRGVGDSVTQKIFTDTSRATWDGCGPFLRIFLWAFWRNKDLRPVLPLGRSTFWIHRSGYFSFYLLSYSFAAKGNKFLNWN